VREIPSAGTLNVLVVDDSAVMRQVMTTVLSREMGIHVDTAAHPLIAMGKMKQRRPDVIVLDIEMPHVDGLTFLQQIMADQPIPVLVCSALAKNGADTVLRALEYGAVDVIQKPAVGIQDFLYEQAIMMVDKVRGAAEARPKRRAAIPSSAKRNSADVVLPTVPSRTLSVTTTRLCASPWAAMSMSFGPIGVPLPSNRVLSRPYAAADSRSKSSGRISAARTSMRAWFSFGRALRSAPYRSSATTTVLSARSAGAAARIRFTTEGCRPFRYAMHAFEVGPSSGTRFEWGERLAKVSPANAFQHRVETLRALRMAGAGEVFEVNRMGGEQHGHTVGRYLAAAESGLPFPP